MNKTEISASFLRGLVTYALVALVAVVVGYLLANQWDYSTFGIAGVLAILLALPLLMRWHYYLLLLSWNTTVVLFFVKGQPKLWLAMVVLSLGFAIVNRAVNAKQRFLRVPQLTVPLLCIAGVMVFTAKMTGGFGLRTLGSEVYGGKKYVLTIISILAYFALTSRRIPPEKAGLALGLFFLGGLTAFIGDLYHLFPSIPGFVFWFFPPSEFYGATGIEALRLGGMAAVASAVFYFMMARYGIRKLFLGRKPLQLILFLGFCFLGLFSGHRALVVTLGGIFLIQFFLEGMQRTKLLPAMVFVAVAGAALLTPFASKLPLTFQRSLAFLPLDISYEAKADAQGSVEWRYDMWDALLPQIPPHLLVGKGYGFSPDDYEMMGRDSSFNSIDASQQGLALAGDYHSGWLSVLIVFGAWGMLATLWLFGAGIYVLHRNYKYGDAAIKTANCFLYADFLVRIAFFLTIGGGGWHSDLFFLVGDLGMSVALNGGLCRPVPAPASVPVAELRAPVAPRMLKPVRPTFQA